jgi:hypothetical protein
MDPILTQLVQREQRKDLLRVLETTRLIKAAGLQPVGLGNFLSQVAGHLSAQVASLVSSRRPVDVTPAVCCPGQC